MVEFYHKHQDKIKLIISLLLAVLILADAIVIVLNATYLATAEIELVITSITGFITIIIIYWALNESRKSNKIIMHQNSIMMHQNKILTSQPIYEDYIQKINKHMERGDIYVFSDEENRILKNDFFFNREGLQLKHLPTALTSLLTIVFDNPLYHKYMQMIERSGDVIVDEADLFGLKKLVTVMDIINNKINQTYNWHVLIEESYKMIVESEFIVKQQKVQLLLKLDKISDDYITLCRFNPIQIGDRKYSFHGRFEIDDIYRFELQEDNNITIVKLKERFASNYCKSYEQIIKYWDALKNLKE